MPPPGSVGGQASQADGVERWGDLPPTVQELFKNQSGEGMPSQYRDWIDAYWKRLNEAR